MEDEQQQLEQEETEYDDYPNEYMDGWGQYFDQEDTDSIPIPEPDLPSE